MIEDLVKSTGRGKEKAKNRMWRTVLVLFLLTLPCRTARADVDYEYVLTKGMVITATNPNGTITITGGSGTERTFSGLGWRKRRLLIPRDERWYGSLGLYDPAESETPYGRLLVDEGRLFFDSESDALRYLYLGSADYKFVFDNHGLVVGFGVENIPGGEPMRRVAIWQIYINGLKPATLRGADDTAVKVSGGIIPDKATPKPAPVGLPVTLGDKEYVPEGTH